ncbi:metallophosphoesterase, calcineurin superfamily [Clostridium aceticum]|uniref:Metallophosphoesterase, calcineurin superfamily n=1 Tax=Clostridium aceticum TaxID=84022 RepID=A0A0G3W8X7_9CLOT|nr:metallophosphoesterase [Clostridium aceticum]AKL94362.1 metallophosphoesterase, calcineurin superfamily [Clostridium aceticum]
MDIVQRGKRWVGLVFNRPYIPVELKEATGPLLLHISDTPQEIYSYIFRLVKLLEPSYIIHTGDLVDDIKLELHPNEIEAYKTALRKFISGLESFTDALIYYAVGNHDQYKEVKKTTSKGIVIKEGHILIEEKNFYVSHYYSKKVYNTDYYLYGHSFRPSSYKSQQHIGLNGLEKIHVIDLTTQKIYHLPYPFGTNQFRKMEQRRISL